MFDKMREASNARTHAEVVKMAEEGQAVAEEVRTAWPEHAAEIYSLLGTSFHMRYEHVKGVGLL